MINNAGVALPHLSSLLLTLLTACSTANDDPETEGHALALSEEYDDP